MGRSLTNTVYNLGLENEYGQAIRVRARPARGGPLLHSGNEAAAAGG